MFIDYKKIYGDWSYAGKLSVDPAKTALIIIDMQKGMLSTDLDGYLRAYSKILTVDLSYFMKCVKTRVIPSIAKLLAFFRERSMRVVHVWCASNAADLSDMPPAKAKWIHRLEEKAGHELYRAWQPETQIVEELAPRQGEPVVMKRLACSFWKTELEFLLLNAGVETLIMTGVNANGCVFETCVSGSNLGFQQVLVSDATTAFHPDLEQFVFEMFPVQFGFVKTADQVIDLLNRR
ncbi:MAG: cysteine hydrolase [Planctomycetota bacterium]